MPENSENQNQESLQEEIKINLLFHQPWKIFGFEAFLFSLPLFLGIIIAFRLSNILKIEKISITSISLWEFIIYFLIATSFILILSFLPKAKKGRRIFYKFLFIFITAYGGLLVLSSLRLPDILSLALIVGLILWWVRKPSVFSHNLATVLGLAGIGAILGLSFTPWAIVLLLIIFSIYDFIAVYKTKHMIKMAKEMIEAGTILGLIIPQKISDFKAVLREIKPGGKFLILGGGDVVFPLLLCVSLISEGILNSLIVAFFALIGLFFSFYIFVSQKVRQPIPALPPIALFSIIGFLITRLL